MRLRSRLERPGRSQTSPKRTLSVNSPSAGAMSPNALRPPVGSSAIIATPLCLPLLVPCSLLGLERSHVDGEAVLHIGPSQSLIGFIDLLDGDDFDIGSDVV